MKVNYCGGDAQERMLKNGWTMVLHTENDTLDSFYRRLSEDYEKVKVYWCSTRVRGYHDHFAMVKNRIWH